MDIAGFSMMSNQVNLMQQVNLAVAKLAMNTAKESTEQMARNIEQSVQPGKGTSIDIRV